MIATLSLPCAEQDRELAVINNSGEYSPKQEEEREEDMIHRIRVAEIDAWESKNDQVHRFRVILLLLSW